MADTIVIGAGVAGRWNWGYVFRRVLQALLIMWATFTLSFVILFIIPGDPALLMLGGGETTVTQEQLDVINEEYGFDQPLMVQYLSYFGSLLMGDLGTSFHSGAPVVSLLTEALGSTLALVAFGTVLGIALGLLVGCSAAYVKNPMLARFLESIPSFSASLPNFWVALLLMQFLSFQLGWFPASGDRGFETLVMPGITLAIPAAASIAQVVSKSLRSAMDEPYIDVARSRGASEPGVFFGHAFRNAILPALTVLGLVVATMFVASAITETIFGRRGIGYMLVQSITTQDIPVVQAAVIVAAGVYVLINLIVDLIYPFLDPRVTLAQGKRKGRRPAPASPAEAAVKPKSEMVP
ncbi:ABC transporter permease [Nesterenkonia muleiensis]|uniref:ABC transporter permease n=1 Tax=Nesterenkonia muleiensis TaxID=2282648 RepID=UPI000E717551|nr:ABC transporter permease [Nesterenkonia muleiensis]